MTDQLRSLPLTKSAEDLNEWPNVDDANDHAIGVEFHDRAIQHPLTLFGIPLGGFSRKTHFLIGVTGTLGFYLLYGFLQEFLFSEPGFRFSLFVTLMQLLTFTVLSKIDIEYHAYNRKLDASMKHSASVFAVPNKTYILMGGLLVLSFGLSNMSLLYLSYPTKVILKASKLIAVMPLGVVVLNKHYSLREYISAAILIIGIVLFTLGDRAIAWLTNVTFVPEESHPAAGGADDSAHQLLFGCILMGASLIADSILGNLQERTLERYHCAPQELVLYNSLVGFALLSIVTLFNGELITAVQYCIGNPGAFGRLLLLTTTGYCGVSVYLVLIKVSGIFVATVVATVRKFLTILLSFMLFPKPFTLAHGIGLICVFGGVLLNSTRKRSK